MSLRGRLIIDKAKSAVSNFITLPVPPYGNPTYWDGCYQSLGPDDSFEWGNLSFADLKRYDYQKVRHNLLQPTGHLASLDNAPSLTASLGETLSAYPHAPTDEHILMLGCGNSKFGEEMIDNGWKGPIVQVDISSRVVESMSQRCQNLQRTGDMLFVQDDATILSAFPEEKAKAIFDKGLVDALFCANEYQQCYNVLQSVHRVLEPNGVYACLSFSEPKFILDKLVLPPGSLKRMVNERIWKTIEVRRLNSIYMYRFQKAKQTTVKKLGTKRSRKRR